MGCGTSFVKYVLFFFNLVVALLGLAIIGVGVAFLLNWSAVKDELKSHLTVAPWVFIVIGAVMFVIAFFGCCGAIRESHCMVVTYAIFLLVIIILQVVLAILLFTYGNNIKEGLVISVQKLWEKRSIDTASDEVFKNLQEQLQCCGSNGSGDYGAVNLPQSCCKKDTLVSNAIGCTIANANGGCSAKVADLYERWNKPIAGFAIGVACVEVVGALFALCLANSIRNMDRRYA
ncbi:CD63 antigen-like isoform X2 [Galleria mellonella]|uniref:Tetraspanin n=1 Tax=Galleria mellonella TaxID=7137 RepID=A0ABM3MR76_GALME|nr:CD63 antigen-like isoform X2 [Galleria mellonella]